MWHPQVTIDGVTELLLPRKREIAKVPDSELEIEYSQAVRSHRDALGRLVVLLRRMVMEALGDVLPGASSIAAVGEFNEDWTPTLRIQRVFDAEGRVVFDVDVGHSDQHVEDAVDFVNTEYLDVLIDLAAGDYFGSVIID